MSTQFMDEEKLMAEQRARMEAFRRNNVGAIPIASRETFDFSPEEFATRAEMNKTSDLAAALARRNSKGKSSLYAPKVAGSQYRAGPYMTEGEVLSGMSYIPPSEIARQKADIMRKAMPPGPRGGKTGQIAPTPEMPEYMASFRERELAKQALASRFGGKTFEQMDPGQRASARNTLFPDLMEGMSNVKMMESEEAWLRPEVQEEMAKLEREMQSLEPQEQMEAAAMTGLLGKMKSLPKGGTPQEGAFVPISQLPKAYQQAFGLEQVGPTAGWSMGNLGPEEKAMLAKLVTEGRAEQTIQGLDQLMSQPAIPGQIPTPAPTGVPGQLPQANSGRVPAASPTSQYPRGGSVR